MFVCLLLLPLLPLHRLAYRERNCWRSAAILACVGWGTLLVLMTEALNLFEAVNFKALAGGWGLVNIGLWAGWCARGRILHRQAKRARMGIGAVAGKSDNATGATLEDEDVGAIPRRTGRWAVWTFGLFVTSILSMLAVIAYIAPPNNNDALTYHLPRVLHWIINGRVDFFATHTLRQIHMNPGAEYIILHLQILAGSDQLANGVQWGALVGATLVASMVAGQLGAGPLGQSLAAVFCVSIPMAILQATNAQNDLAVGFWLLCFISLALMLMNEFRVTALVVGRPRRTPFKEGLVWFLVIGTGAALGLALLTKATAYLFAFPFGLWVLIQLSRQLKLASIGIFAAMAGMTLLINAGHFTRNAELYGSPLGPTQEGETPGQFKYSNDSLTPRVIVSNCIRNLALELTIQNQDYNHGVENSARAVLRWIGADPADPRTTWTQTDFATVSQWGHFPHQEDLESSPGHVALIVVSLLLLPFFRKKFGPVALIYTACAVGGMLMFCGILRWQPWNSRLHLPMFMIWTPIIAVVLTAVLNRWVLYVIGLSALAGAVPPLIHGSSHPLTGKLSIFTLPREQQFYMNSPQLYGINQQMIAIVKNQRAAKIGLITDGNLSEYPLWVLLHQSEPTAEMQEVEVKNLSARFVREDPDMAFKPNLIFTIKPSTGEFKVDAPHERQAGSER